jgi:RNA polymerase sigma-70 factor (ECF subfamily)
MIDQTPDKIQVEKIIKGDRQAFREILDKYHPMVINTCNGFLHNRQDAEDIAQEVFIEIHNSIKTFRHEAKLSTWIYRIAVNKSLNQVRKNKRWRWIQSIEDVFSQVEAHRSSVRNDYTADGDFESQQQKAILQSALNDLPENQKIAFTLNKYEELSYKEISEIMSVSLSSVESLIHRAKINLQKKLLHLIEKS